MAIAINRCRENNSHWKGGIIKLGISGYKRIRINKIYRLYHRYIYEQHHKCCLLPYAIIHHIDSDPTNNNIENLQLIDRKIHGIIHNTKDKNNRLCKLCNQKTKIRSNGLHVWYGNEIDGFMCYKCYQKQNNTKRRNHK